MLDKLLNNKTIIDLLNSSILVDISLINIMLFALTVYVLVRVFRYINNDDE